MGHLFDIQCVMNDDVEFELALKFVGNNTSL